LNKVLLRRISLAICVLLLVALPFRWEKGPQQTISKNKSTKCTVIYKTDRWTGDQWVKIYKISRSNINVNFIPVALENLNRSIPEKPWPGWGSQNYDKQLKKWEVKVALINAQKASLRKEYNDRRNTASAVWAGLFLVSTLLVWLNDEW